jgi:hypothetical protein
MLAPNSEVGEQSLSASVIKRHERRGLVRTPKHATRQTRSRGQRVSGSSRRPIEAIEARGRHSAECETRVRKALVKLVRSGTPFTVEDVCELADVGKTFVYDKRRPELTRSVLEARNASQNALVTTAYEEPGQGQDAASWRERALNAEALTKSLRASIRERDALIADLTGRLCDHEGTHLADENTRLRDLLSSINTSLRESKFCLQPFGTVACPRSGEGQTGSSTLTGQSV